MQNLASNISWADIGGLLLGLAAIVTAVIGGIKQKESRIAIQAASAKAKAEAEKLKADGSAAQAEAIRIYAEASGISQKQNSDLQDRINRLEKKVDELLKIIRRKDERIQELEILSRSQKTSIANLRCELDKLRAQLNGKKLSE